MFQKNIYIKKAYQEYLEELLINKNKLTSVLLTKNEIKALEQSKYDLTQFEIYLFIKNIDYLWSQGNYTITLREGITEDKNKFRNVLIDLYYQNINKEEVFNTPISFLFGFNYYKGKAQNIDVMSLNLKKKNENKALLDNIYIIKNIYKSYFGNYDTYAVLKQLIKIYLKTLNLYYYRGKVYNVLQLLNVYDLSNEYYTDYGVNWYAISKKDPELVNLKYKCISVEDPEDITSDSLSDIKINFILEDLNSKYVGIPEVNNKNFKLKDFWFNEIVTTKI